jgi:hypothetical protein
MTHASYRAATVACAIVVLGAMPAWAQEPPPTAPPATTQPQPTTARGQRGRANAPPAGPMNQQQLQDYLDVHTFVVAERDLQLTGDQLPTFVARLRRLQQARRQQLNQRNRAMRELAPLVAGAGPFKDDEILQRFKTFDEANQRALQEIRQAELELDGVLTPWQRVRFRMLEERLERQKIEMLVKLRGVRDGG